MRVFVTNLSGEGLRLAGCLLEVGEVCRLIAPDNSEFIIEVRWVDGGHCGAKFID